MQEKTKIYSDGYHLVVKQECETCKLVEPVIRVLANLEHLNIYVQDAPSFLADLHGHQYDGDLENSFYLNIETVPTLVTIKDRQEHSRVFGWQRDAWRELTGINDLGETLPAWRPGCGSKSVEPGVAEKLQATFSKTGIQSRILEPGDWQDEHEYCYERGWSDGLPIIPQPQSAFCACCRGYCA